MHRAVPRILLTAGLLGLAGAAWGQNTLLRCPDGLVEIGDTKFEVREKCGEPAHERFDLWVYDFGPGQFRRRLQFADEELVTIEVDEER
jgi:hypothetical protein